MCRWESASVSIPPPVRSDLMWTLSTARRRRWRRALTLPRCARAQRAASTPRVTCWTWMRSCARCIPRVRTSQQPRSLCRWGRRRTPHRKHCLTLSKPSASRVGMAILKTCARAGCVRSRRCRRSLSPASRRCALVGTCTPQRRVSCCAGGMARARTEASTTSWRCGARARPWRGLPLAGCTRQPPRHCRCRYPSRSSAKRLRLLRAPRICLPVLRWLRRSVLLRPSCAARRARQR
mmetsp:Transcript_12333/g.51900  ORF Transcript_12333/g.51900 Transcript_12333/m.51900 type:complete len:236 (-) Transcript_12333:177-884(-)